MMSAIQRRMSTRSMASGLLVIGVVLTSGSCARQITDPETEIDLTPFKAMASEAICSETRNRLFLVDKELVFWDVAGDCTDAGFAQILFAGKVDSVIAKRRDSIAGLIVNYFDPDYRDLFDTMVENLDRGDLGVGDNHLVEVIPF